MLRLELLFFSARVRLEKVDSPASILRDKVCLSRQDSINGYSAEAQSKMPHAWKSGTQVQLLKSKVKGMKKGGTFVMVPPPNPYRCPPGPYERVSMIAHQFTKSNPTAKIIILDPKKKFSKQGLFMEAWDRHYPGMIEWLDPETHGGIKNINVDTMEFETDLETFKADAASVVPLEPYPQQRTFLSLKLYLLINFHKVPLLFHHLLKQYLSFPSIPLLQAIQYLEGILITLNYKSLVP